MTLSDLKLNQEAIIKKINGEKNFKNRLLNIGFEEDKKVVCILISPFGNPKAYQINNILIALRNEDAKQIEVDIL